MRIHLLAVTLIAATPLFAQSRQANIIADGSPDQGKCLVEVVVDGSAEVQLRGTTAVLNNLGGSAPQWRRFDCNAPMPLNPNNFAVTSVSGRGRQQITRQPSDGGVAIVRIDDPSGGASTYSFSTTWQGSGPSTSG